MNTNDIERLTEMVGTNPTWTTPEVVTAFIDTEHSSDPRTEKVYRQVKRAAERHGWHVQDDRPMVSYGSGYETTFGETRMQAREIRIDNTLNPLRKVLTLLHEVGHTFHGPSAYSDAYTETFAESVAFLIAQAFGWPVEGMAAYLTIGAGPERIPELRTLIRQMAPVTVAVANRIIREAHLEPLLLAA